MKNHNDFLSEKRCTFSWTLGDIVAVVKRKYKVERFDGFIWLLVFDVCIGVWKFLSRGFGLWFYGL